MKFKDVFHQEPKANVIRNYILNALKSEGIALTQENENLVDANSSEILSKFMIEEALAYYEIDSITGLIKDQDEIHEIFVRANSGGVQASKSDLVFSTIVLEWPDADSNIERLIHQINKQGKFSFDKDFVIKCCLTFVGAGAKYDIQKLRGENGHKNLANITADWKKIADSLRSTVDFLERNGIISSNVLYSNNALIPIIYHAFQNGGVLES